MNLSENNKSYHEEKKIWEEDTLHTVDTSSVHVAVFVLIELSVSQNGCGTEEIEYIAKSLIRRKAHLLAKTSNNGFVRLS